MNNFMLLSFSTANVLSDNVYFALCGILSIAVLVGIHLMSKVEKAQLGNKISAIAIALAIVITLIKNDILPLWLIYPGVIIGLIIGLVIAKRVKMIQMPQLVALLNGVGGAASAIVASFAFIKLYPAVEDPDFFGRFTSSLAIAIGSITLFGSLVAAGKLHKVLSQKPVTLPLHQVLSMGLLIILLALVVFGGFFNLTSTAVILMATILIASAFGIVFSIRVGGADMPITISLLNSFSGVAAAVTGFAIGDVLLVSVGGIVGASGLFLTQIMCRAMNRSLMDILLGKTSAKNTKVEKADVPEASKEDEGEQVAIDPVEAIKNAKTAIIVPGYGMALAQAQHLVNTLAKKMKTNGTSVKYAVHPVAGRMPGHMDVLLVEAGVGFDDVYEMDDVNEEFKDVDVTIVIGANDVLNPAARHAEGTPIYGMPILNVDECKNIVIFNYDLKPGYSGVDNPIYKRKEGVVVVQGDAAKTIAELLDKI
ncbi:MAG TPA: NAD(P)(+) transhydrogenase (Re/Si-specific) subunit beta [Perlabentimonas sp.]|nr:NAD(P)(+) transhydrogenase (Re/Si-specific) subunit beta [Bacteroidales bacterium]MDD4671647.1 NAD(P)(+) transhydrogenase (Re/Si-specific) subunit beta [Bacteroidales bacterium]MDY0349375.1 NAD(P)(+) transhydrogenase (Re/Si-specific) subunit beta [Tenuifilaceae bacterium]HZJ73437.1 NAD(P)(+) transhydrogenase (Re/Si-specific) subunit beta [Perlabentimonas sp.]